MSNVVTLKSKPTATKGKPAKPAASKRTASKPVAIPTRQKAAGALFGSLALTMAGLSLSHLASGFAMATHRPMTEGWVMASATDIGFVAAELLPFLATGAACADLKHARLGLTAAVVAASAYFNVLSMGPWGLAVPAALAMFTHMSSRLLIGRSR